MNHIDFFKIFPTENDAIDFIVETNLQVTASWKVRQKKNYTRTKVDHSMTYSLGDGKHTNDIESAWKHLLGLGIQGGLCNFFSLNFCEIFIIFY